MGQREDFVAKARAEIGTVEEGNNLTKYGKFTKHDGQPWCGSFCMWVAHEAGLKIPNVVSTMVGAAEFKKLGTYTEAAKAKPEPGDIVFFDFAEGGAPIEHVGIVVKDNLDGSIVTVEGNTTPDKKTGSQANGGEVAMKVRGYQAGNKRKLPVFVVGFGRPTWTK